jgi:hypothetical protein
LKRCRREAASARALGRRQQPAQALW